MFPLVWLVIFFFVLCFLVLLVYVLVVRAFYLGDKKDVPPNENENKRKLILFYRALTLSLAFAPGAA